MTVEVSPRQETSLSPQDLKGNDWKFAEYNIDLSPSENFGYKEHRWNSLSPKLQKVIRGLNYEHITPPWKFESALLPEKTSENGWLNFSLIFSNPYVDILEKVRPQVSNPSDLTENFIRESSRYSGNPVEGYLPERQIDALLEGTNYLAGNVQYKFNPVLLEESSGLFKKKLQKEIYYQMGVAYVVMNLVPISRGIEEEESGIRTMISEFQGKLAERRAVLSRLRSRKVPNPISLF